MSGTSSKDICDDCILCPDHLEVRHARIRSSCERCPDKSSKRQSAQPSLKFIDQSDWVPKRHPKRRARPKSDTWISYVPKQQQHAAFPEDEDRVGVCRSNGAVKESPRPALGQEVLSSHHRRGFEVLVHTTLASYHIARTNAALSWRVEPSRMRVSLARATRLDPVLSTYISYIPRRLGYNLALDNAASCLLGGVASLTDLDDPQTIKKCLVSYHLAIQSLQASLRDPALATTPETICAVMLLGVFECMIGTDSLSWLRQVSGLMKLFRLRGPSEDMSDFERMILSAAMGGFIVDALVTNQPCFLDEPEWRSIVLGDFHNQTKEQVTSGEGCGILPYICPIPTLMRDCREIVRSPKKQTQARIADLLERTEELRRALLDIAIRHKWLTRAFNELLVDKDGSARYLFNQDDLMTGNYCNFCMGLAMVNRIVMALRVSPASLEIETNRLAEVVLDFHSLLIQDRTRQGLYKVLSLRIAYSVLHTAPAWKSRVHLDETELASAVLIEGSVISAGVFNEFDDLICGRRPLACGQ